MRLTCALAAIALAAATTFPVVADAQQAPPAAARYVTNVTAMRSLLNDPAAKPVLARHIPDVVANAGTDQARGMTLKQIQPFSPPSPAKS